MPLIPGHRPRILACALLLMVAAPANTQPLAPAPEAATGRIAKATATAQRFMVAAANPLAADKDLRRRLDIVFHLEGVGFLACGQPAILDSEALALQEIERL